MYPLKFWVKNRALLFGLAALLGTYFALLSPLALIPFLFLLHKKHLYLTLFFFLLPLITLYHFYDFPPSGTVVEGRFHIHSLHARQGFANGWIYTGILKTKKGRLRCRIASNSFHAADCAYDIIGTLTTHDRRFYALRPSNWEKVSGSFSFAQIRYQAKKWVQSYIDRNIKQQKAAHFLSGMVTGELEDRVLQRDFGNLGLSHIMAISGFHFALLTLAFHFFFRLILSYKIEIILLMLVLTLYLLFIGDTPSIQRAWSVAMVFLLGGLLERPALALNSLGVALLFATLLNPHSSLTLSFQLSFLATGGILLGYQPINSLAKHWIPSLPLKKAQIRSLLWQHGFLFVSLVRQALALTGAVHFALIPLLLAYFHTFPLNSLIYNLFFPFCAGIALFLFLLSISTGGLLHPLNGWYCEKLMLLTESPPLSLKPFYLENISNLFIVTYLTILFIILIIYHEFKLTNSK